MSSCNKIESADLKARCQTAFDACEALEGNAYQASCRFRVETCIDQYLSNASSYQIETSRGTPLNYHAPESCFAASVRVTKNLGPLGRFAETPKTPPPPKSGSGARAGKTGAKTTHPEYEICENTGPQGSEKNNLCRERVGICLSNGPYDIPLGSSAINYSDRASCLRGVKRLSRAAGGARPSEPKKEPAPSNAPAPIENQVAAKPDEATSAPDGKRKFEVPFDYADFLPEVGDDNEFKTTILTNYDGGVKGLDIRVKYSLEEIGGGRYKMTYKIFGEEDKRLCGEKTVEFKTSGGKITDNLVFAINLRQEGDFGSVASVEVVKK